MARRGLFALLDVVWPAQPNRPLPPAAGVRKILLVRVNFRMGNTVLATALVPMLRERYPQAQIDCLAAEGPHSLLDGLPFGRVHLVSRRFIRAPWRFVRLFAELRRQRYDLAIDGALRSFSGALYAWLSGARERVGGEGKADHLLTVRLPRIAEPNIYAVQKLLARQLGTDETAARPLYAVTPAEAEEAQRFLAGAGSPRGGGVAAGGSFAAVFVGGHQSKRWPRQDWLELCDRLAEETCPVLVFVGPEERDFLPELQARARGAVRVVPPQRLRAFAALLARAGLLITPDSGPLHLAAAIGIPLLVVIQTDGSRNFVPAGPENVVVSRPDSGGLHAALRAHPAYARMAAGG